MDILHIMLLFAALLIGELVSSLIVKRYFSTRSQIKLAEDLMAAINRARNDVMAANKLIEEMEGINLHLRVQNQQLTADNNRLVNLTAQLRGQLNAALDDIEFWQKEIKKVFPTRPEPKKPGQKNE